MQGGYWLGAKSRRACREGDTADVRGSVVAGGLPPPRWAQGESQAALDEIVERFESAESAVVQLVVAAATRAKADDDVPRP